MAGQGSEALIRKQAKKQLEEAGWLVWIPPLPRFTKFLLDIFNIADCIAAKGGRMVLIQWTTLHHKSARMKKIQAVLKQHLLTFGVELWCWDGEKFHYFTVFDDSVEELTTVV